jgi:hypothetical protein
MSRLDVLKSLLRSAATEAGGRIERLTHTGPLRKVIDQLATGNKLITDAQLTAALARMPGATATTVRSSAGGLYVDAGFTDGEELRVQLLPEGVTFAPHGAKEIRVRVSPPSAAVSSHASDALVEIGQEIARVLWGPFLPPQQAQATFTAVQRDGDVLILDLRSLPAVRAALSQRLRAMAMEAVTLQGLTAATGGLQLAPHLTHF